MSLGMATAENVRVASDILTSLRDTARNRCFAVAEERDRACVRHGYLLAIEEIEKALERRAEE